MNRRDPRGGGVGWIEQSETQQRPCRRCWVSADGLNPTYDVRADEVIE